MTPTVFLSYSWDDTEHQDWVRSLAERLVTNGIKVRLDAWEVQPGDSLTAFMEEAVDSSDFTLVICTPNYCSKSTERKGGVGYEQQIISGRIASGVSRRKFIPIVREGSFSATDTDCAIPPHFLGIFAIDLRPGTNYEESFEKLVRAIFSSPNFRAPQLGAPPSFSDEPLPQRALRLPSLEFDGWELTSGVATNEQFPETFHIPTEEERAHVQIGDFVKLSFSVPGPASDDPEDEEIEIWGERMWVQVKGRPSPYLWGELNNIPSWGDAHPDLKVGREVVFLPEHIIDIHPETE